MIRLKKFNKYVYKRTHVIMFDDMQVLKELIEIIIRSVDPRMKKNWQKLLRNLMVLEMVVHILEKFDPKAHDAR